MAPPTPQIWSNGTGNPLVFEAFSASQEVGLVYCADGTHYLKRMPRAKQQKQLDQDDKTRWDSSGCSKAKTLSTEIEGSSKPGNQIQAPPGSILGVQGAGPGAKPELHHDRAL